MPPPTRPVLTLSRAAFASEKFAGFEAGEVDSIAAAAEAETEASPRDFRERDAEMASNVSVAFCVGDTPTESRDPFSKFDNLVSSVPLELVSAFVGKTTPEGSKILMGTRRRAGTDCGSEEAWMNGAGFLDFWKPCF